MTGQFIITYRMLLKGYLLLSEKIPSQLNKYVYKFQKNMVIYFRIERVDGKFLNLSTFNKKTVCLEIG